MEAKSKKETGPKTGGFLASAGALSGLAALIGASCCVLPIILVNLGVSVALVGKLAFFANARPLFMTATIVLIVAAFAAAFWRGRRPNRSLLILLAAAGFFAAGAQALPYFESDLLNWLNLR